MVTAVTEWGGRKVQEARAYLARYLPAPCGKCGKTVHPDPAGTRPGRSGWVVGHKVDRNTHPHLTWEPSNWQPEHRSCSDASGQAAVIAKARAEGAASVQHTLFDASGMSVSPAVDALRKPPPLPVSLPATGEPIETNPLLAWSSAAMLDHWWLTEFAEVPGDASPPLFMSPVPADAVGSYAAEPCQIDRCCGGLTAIEWIEKAERKTLRWWQRLKVSRQLEHRDDGSLIHREILSSGPRRIGKSVSLRGVALWRMKHGYELFGETQTLVHTGNNLAICREIQRGAWRWAQDNEWEVTRANGKEALESPDGDRWLVRAQDAVYGYDVTFGMGDECWDVKPETVTEGLEPATLERLSAQIELTSTAHRQATSLMRTKIRVEITAAECTPGVLILLWAAPFGSDPGDPATWRAASPHWSDDRLRMITEKYAKALAGEADPAADDPDPMAGFVAQYLNVWPMTAVDSRRGNPIATEHTWTPLADQRPTTVPVAAAIESWFGAGVSVALSWRDPLGRAIVSVTEHADLAQARHWVEASGFRGKVTVGKSLIENPALRGLRTEAGEGRVGSAAEQLERLIGEDGLRHDGTDHLGGQVLALRVVPSVDGARMVSNGRGDAVKAAVWAAHRARKTRPRRPARIVTARK